MLECDKRTGKNLLSHNKDRVITATLTTTKSPCKSLNPQITQEAVGSITSKVQMRELTHRETIITYLVSSQSRILNLHSDSKIHHLKLPHSSVCGP